jgi:hypothetical protein
LRKKALSIAFLIAIMVGCSALVTALHIGVAQSDANVTDKNVTGIIASNQTWTQANSPYTLTGNVLVYNGVTLTIEAGVTVNLGNYYIEVNGTLQAIGSSTNLITINAGTSGYLTFTVFSTGWDDASSSGSIIEDAVVNAPLNLYNSTKIFEDVVNDGIAVPDSFSSYPTVMPQISNNFIQGGINVGTYENALILNNTITGANGIVLSPSFGGVNPGQGTIIGNTISGCGTGINIGGGGSGSPTLSQVVQNNLIVNNSVGIEIYTFIISSYPTIQNNTIAGNGIGISVYLGDPVSNPINPTIVGNNIYNNANYNVEDQIPYSVNATYNWWGTTNSQAINQTLYGRYNDFNLGIVSYTPFLVSPNIQAPTYIASSAGVGGSIAPSGIVRLNYGDSKTFKITPSTGYYIANVLVNGTAVGAVTSYTVQNIQGATTISATFAPNPTPAPSPSPTSSTSSSSSPTASATASPSPTPTASSPSQFSVSEFPSFLVVLTVFVAVSLSIVVLVTVRKSRMCLNNPVEENG